MSEIENLIRENSEGYSNLDVETFTKVLKFTLSDKLEDGLNGTPIIEEAVARMGSNPEIASMVSDGFLGRNQSHELDNFVSKLGDSDIIEEAVARMDSNPEINLGGSYSNFRKALFDANMGNTESKSLNIDFMGEALKQGRLTDGIYSIEEVTAAVQFAHDLPDESYIKQQMSPEELKDLTKLNGVVNSLSDDLDQDKVNDVRAKYQAMQDAGDLKVDNRSTIESYRASMDDLINDPDGGSISGSRLPDPIPDQKQILENKEKQIRVEGIDWQERYKKYMDSQSDSFVILSTSDKLKAKFSNGFSPRNDTLFGTTIANVDAYGDPQESLLRLSPLTNAIRVSKEFDYSNPQLTSQIFTMSALKARANGWSEIHLTHPGPDAKAKMFLENAIKAMVDVGEYDLDAIFVPKRYQHVLDKFKNDLGQIQDFSLDPNEMVAASELLSDEPAVDAPDAPEAGEPAVDAPDAPEVGEPAVDEPDEPEVAAPSALAAAALAASEPSALAAAAPESPDAPEFDTPETPQSWYDEQIKNPDNIEAAKKLKDNLIAPLQSDMVATPETSIQASEISENLFDSITTKYITESRNISELSLNNIEDLGERKDKLIEKMGTDLFIDEVRDQMFKIDEVGKKLLESEKALTMSIQDQNPDTPQNSTDSIDYGISNQGQSVDELDYGLDYGNNSVDPSFNLSPPAGFDEDISSSMLDYGEPNVPASAPAFDPYPEDSTPEPEKVENERKRSRSSKLGM